MSDDREQELAQFREAWKAEVSERKKPHQGQSNPRSVGQSSRQQLDEIPRHSQDNAHTAVSAGALPVIEDHHRGVDVDRKNVPSAGSLEALLDSFPEGLTFLPEVGESPPPIASLPDELLLHILRKLGPDSIERLACVCRKARVLTLEPVIWKELVEMTYKPPQIPANLSTSTIVKLYNLDYRRTFVELPRVRVDGVYIAVCHYIRQGLSENAWINVTHLITYHRYLRFLPNGEVLSLLAAEDHSPKDIISRLQPNTRTKGLLIGTWELRGKNVTVRNLLDAAHIPLQTHAPMCFAADESDLDMTPSMRCTCAYNAHRVQPSSPPRYNFQMHLGLRSRPKGRWNKLELLAYESVALEDGEVSQFSLKNEKGYWFSRVKSWGW